MTGTCKIDKASAALTDRVIAKKRTNNDSTQGLPDSNSSTSGPLAGTEICGRSALRPTRDGEQPLMAAR